MNKNIRVTLLTAIALFIFFLTWIVTLYGTAGLVSIFGIHNIYALAFFVAAIASATIVTSASYYAFVIALTTNADVNIYLLSVIMGAGMTVGDIFFFSIGKETRTVLPKGIKKNIDKIAEWLVGKKNRHLSVITFLWAGFMPLPNDVITVSTGIASANWKYVIPSIFLGNIVFIYLFAYVLVPYFF